MTLTDHDLSDLLAALKAGEMTDTIRTSLEWILQPRFGGYLVAAWLAGIITNLLMIGDFYDVALRDFGLLLAALTLARLAVAAPQARRS